MARITLEEIFKPGGLLDSHLPEYEFRPSQLEMASAVLRAIEDHSHLLVEAGTGTGKTLAYLIPGLVSGRRMLVSTATRNLQDQIFCQDIPFLRRYLFPELRAVYMKGRQNYICLRRYHSEGRQLLLDAAWSDRSSLLDEWLKGTRTGDRAELEWLEDDESWWDRLDARSDTCTGQKCRHFEECFITRMRKSAFSADVVVVNHALFFSNLALETDEIGRVLPDCGVLVLDEAHEVEETAGEYFGLRLSNYQLEDLCRHIRHESLARLPRLGKAVDRLENAQRIFFAGVPAVEGRHSLNFFRPPYGGPTVDLRDDLAGAAVDVREALRIVAALLEMEGEKSDETEPLLRRIERCESTLFELFERDQPGSVYWFQRSGRGVFLNLTPIDVGPILREKLFGKKESVILTSATLTVGGEFSYFSKRVGLDTDTTEQLTVPGEFDFQRQAALYVPRALPDPRAPGYFGHLLLEIRALLELTRGSAFLLFTSFQMLERVYRALAESEEYPLLRQGDAPKVRLLEEFKATPGAVLCATSSFWQGVDVRGDALKAVVVDKLPFQVPSEPLVAARLERLSRDGVNGFLEYSVPEATIALRQGLGRLIRSRTDTGILAVLDSRLWTRFYGKHFFNSLPNCPVADNIEDLENLFLRIGSRKAGGK